VAITKSSEDPGDRGEICTLRGLAQAYGVSKERIRYLAAKGQRLEATPPAPALD